MSRLVRWSAVLVALVACRRTPRIDTRAITPLVRASTTEDAGDAGRARTQGNSRSRRGVRYVSDRPAPEGALGVRWGNTRAEVTARNAAATPAIECRDSGPYIFCRRALVEVPIPVVVTYEFCGTGLCAVSVDGPPTRDEAQMNAHYDSLLDMVKRSLGDPPDAARAIGPGCAGHLALCLASRQAELSAHWSWRDGPQVQLSVDQDEEDAFRALPAVTWFSAERARRQEAADEASPAVTDGGAARIEAVSDVP